MAHMSFREGMLAVLRMISMRRVSRGELMVPEGERQGT